MNERRENEVEEKKNHTNKTNEQNLLEEEEEKPKTEEGISTKEKLTKKNGAKHGRVCC